MTDEKSKTPMGYSVLVQRTVLFWERVQVSAETPEEAAELAEGLAGAYNWSNSHEMEVSFRVERDGDVLTEVIWGG